MSFLLVNIVLQTLWTIIVVGWGPVILMGPLVFVLNRNIAHLLIVVRLGHLPLVFLALVMARVVAVIEVIVSTKVFAMLLEMVACVMILSIFGQAIDVKPPILVVNWRPVSVVFLVYLIITAVGWVPVIRVV